MKLINPAQHKQLFLDDGAIESRTGVKRVLHQPEKQGPVIGRDRSRQETMVQSFSAPSGAPKKRSGSGGIKWKMWFCRTPVKSIFAVSYSIAIFPSDTLKTGLFGDRIISPWWSYDSTGNAGGTENKRFLLFQK